MLLDGSTILVTGGTGLIGSALVRHLLESYSCRIVLPVRNVAKAKKMFGERTNVIFVEYDFAKDPSECFESALRMVGSVDFIVHGACPTDSKFMKECPEETKRIIVDGTRQVLDFAKSCGVKSMVYLSSMEVYGEITDDSVAVTEDVVGPLDEGNPRSSYPLGKRQAESLCISYSREFEVPVKIARLTQTFGPGIDVNNDNRVFAQFIRCARDGRNIELLTAGKTKRMYLHVSDAVSAILTLLLKGENGEAYNVANESTYCSIREMAEFARDLLNPSICASTVAGDTSAYLNEIHMKLSTAKISSLGWVPKYGLKEMFLMK